MRGRLRSHWWQGVWMWWRWPESVGTKICASWSQLITESHPRLSL